MYYNGEVKLLYESNTATLMSLIRLFALQEESYVDVTAKSVIINNIAKSLIDEMIIPKTISQPYLTWKTATDLKSGIVNSEDLIKEFFTEQPTKKLSRDYEKCMTYLLGANYKQS